MTTDRTAEPLAQGGIVSPDAQPFAEQEDPGDYLPRVTLKVHGSGELADAVRRALAAAPPLHLSEPDDLDRLISDSMQDPVFVRSWLAAQEREVEQRVRAAYERGKAEGIAEATRRATAATLRQVAGWGAIDEGELHRLAGEVGTLPAPNGSLETLCCPMCEEVDCDDSCPLAPVRGVVSRLVGPWEPAEQPEPDRCPSCSRPSTHIRDQGDGPTVARKWLPCGCTQTVPAGGAG